MSSGTAPCGGYVLEVSVENFTLFGLDKSQEFIEYLEEYGIEAENVGLSDIEIFLDECNTIRASIVGTNGLVCFSVTPTYYNSEDGGPYDELEDGWYFVFEENDLYKRKLSQLGEALTDKDCMPWDATWTTFG